MSSDRDTTRIVRSWLDEGVTQLPDRVLDAVLDQIPATPQRRVSWPLRWRRSRIGMTVQIAVAVVVVLAIAMVGTSFLQLTANLGGPGRTPLPAASPSALPLGGGTQLSAGSYSVGDPYPVRITFDVPQGWAECSPDRLERAVCAPTMEGVGFMVVDNVVADPCDQQRTGLDPPARSVDDVVAAISNLRGFEATDPIDITHDGYTGKRLEVSAPEVSPCAIGEDLGTWSTTARTNGVRLGETNLLHVLDVEGATLLIAAAYFPSETPDYLLAEVRRVFDSVHLVP
jgi:hypothetical protein